MPRYGQTSPWFDDETDPYRAETWWDDETEDAFYKQMEQNIPKNAAAQAAAQAAAAKTAAAVVPAANGGGLPWWVWGIGIGLGVYFLFGKKRRK